MQLKRGCHDFQYFYHKCSWHLNLKKKKEEKNLTLKTSRRWNFFVFRIEILLHLGIPDNQILFNFGVPDNQILLYFGVPDNCSSGPGMVGRIYSLSSCRGHQNGMKFGCPGQKNRVMFVFWGHWNRVKFGCWGQPIEVKF